MNPRSGGGKAAKSDLKRTAQDLGTDVFLISGHEPVDVAKVAADGIPFAFITAGTRNHFALDLGLDRDDPSACLDALRDGVELRVDLGMNGARLRRLAMPRGRAGTARSRPVRAAKDGGAVR